MRVLRRVQPRAVLGAGGFVSGPGGIAAWLMRMPLLIHEQNAIAGMTNRWLARLADAGARGVPRQLRPARSRDCIGNPVRADIAAIAPPARALRRALGESRAFWCFGGSQGAQRLNALVPEALAHISAGAPAAGPAPGRRARPRGRARGLSHVTGRCRSRPPFIDDMAAGVPLGGSRACAAPAP